MDEQPDEFIASFRAADYATDARRENDYESSQALQEPSDMPPPIGEPLAGGAIVPFRLPVRFDTSEPHVTADTAEKSIMGAGLHVFHRGGMLVEPCIERVPSYGGGWTIQIVTLKNIEEARLVDLMSQSTAWEKYSTREKKYVTCPPPRDAARILMARAGFWKLPRVSGVITTPTLRYDGSILSEPGYDPQTQLFHEVDPTIRLPEMKRKPTRSDALASVKLLEWLLDEFPFADPRIDLSVALSALMTPVMRAAMDVAPMHAIKAPAYGSGKSFLVNLASAIAIGAPCPVTTAGGDESETEKRLDAALLKCQPIISLDNVNGELCSDKLAVAVEQQKVSVRILGMSKTIEIENRASIFATGCNILVRGDMVRRTILCSIDPNEESPEKRSFARNPYNDILADREKIYSGHYDNRTRIPRRGRTGRRIHKAGFIRRLVAVRPKAPYLARDGRSWKISGDKREFRPGPRLHHCSLCDMARRLRR